MNMLRYWRYQAFAVVLGLALLLLITNALFATGTGSATRRG